MPNVVLDHVVLDGSRFNRLTTAPATSCANGDNSRGFNAANHGCNGCQFTNSVSMWAVCGTGYEWTGLSPVITDSVFAHNGDHFTKNMWSDGLTLNSADGALVSGCTFLDNSDVNLIIGGGVAARLENNLVVLRQNGCFAGSCSLSLFLPSNSECRAVVSRAVRADITPRRLLHDVECWSVGVLRHFPRHLPHSNMHTADTVAHLCLLSAP